MYAVFGLGFFGTICAIVRFNFLVIVNNSRDPFYDSLPINTWSVIEVNVGIVCASLPTLRPLFSKAQRQRTKQALKVPDVESLDERNGSRRRGLLQVKEMFISINTASFTDSKSSTLSRSDDEWKRATEHPPPVPPKDVRPPKMKRPEMTYQRL